MLVLTKTCISSHITSELQWRTDSSSFISKDEHTVCTVYTPSVETTRREIHIYRRYVCCFLKQLRGSLRDNLVPEKLNNF